MEATSRLCARFLLPDGKDSLAIWLPQDALVDERDLARRYAEMACEYTFPIVLIGWVSESDLRMCGDIRAVDRINQIGPETLDWRPTDFIG